jgi:hypothetical protein
VCTKEVDLHRHRHGISLFCFEHPSRPVLSESVDIIYFILHVYQKFNKPPILNAFRLACEVIIGTMSFHVSTKENL